MADLDGSWPLGSCGWLVAVEILRSATGSLVSYGQNTNASEEESSPGDQGTSGFTPPGGFA